jgi:hypothetical protein
MKIALGFSRTNNLPSKLIRLFTKGQVSHTYLRIYDTFFQQYFVLHADWDGVKIELADKFDLENNAIEEFIINDKRLNDAIRKGLWHLGKKYDYIKLFNWAWAIIFKRWIVRKVKDPVVDPKKLICVDFDLYILNDAGITNLEIGHYNPKEFLEWCRSNYEQLGWKRISYDEGKTIFDLVKSFLRDEE